MGLLKKLLMVILPLSSNAQNATSSHDPFAIDNWSVAQGELNGKLIFMRFNAGFKEFKDKKKYPFRIGFAFPLLKPKENGLPTDEEMNQLNLIEDELDKTLAQTKLAFLTMAITTDGMREFVFYSNKPDAVRKKIDILKKAIKSHELQFYIETDKNWSVYYEYVK